jgi:methylthioribose-1-phosphate isomerase
MPEIEAITYANGKLGLLDQTGLPAESRVVWTSDYHEVIRSVQLLRVRGAPALGVAAAYAVVMAADHIDAPSRDEFLAKLREAGAEIVSARPTAVNMAWAVERMLDIAGGHPDVPAIKAALLMEAQTLQREDEDANRRMGAHGAALMPEGGAVLTHCNTGALATAGFGTALGVIRAAWEGGKRFSVFATETRPVLQGARLTTWELVQLGIPATLIVDSAAGMLMRGGEISCVITGADRIAANGDTANKIGTYSLAVLAREHGLPFYIAAPTSTVDLRIGSGDDIPIEERDASEVTGFREVRTAAEGIAARNPAFDVTPHRYIDAIVTEHGVARPPYSESLDLALRAQAGADR